MQFLGAAGVRGKFIFQIPYRRSQLLWKGGRKTEAETTHGRICVWIVKSTKAVQSVKVCTLMRRKGKLFLEFDVFFLCWAIASIHDRKGYD